MPEQERMFPIQASRSGVHPTRIPWSVAELAYTRYVHSFGHGQTLERLAERGGFGAEEMDSLLPDWRQRCDEIHTLRRDLDGAKAQRERAVEALLLAQLSAIEAFYEGAYALAGRPLVAGTDIEPAWNTSRAKERVNDLTVTLRALRAIEHKETTP